MPIAPGRSAPAHRRSAEVVLRSAPAPEWKWIDDAEVLARRPERVVLRVVVGARACPTCDGSRMPREPVLARPAHLAHRLVDVPERRHDRDADAALGRHRAELGEPAVVGARARPLQLGHDVLGRQREAGAERRHVHLGDAVREDDLAGDAVAVEHARGARRGPTRPRASRSRPAPPLRVDVGDQELLLRRLRHLRAGSAARWSKAARYCGSR